MTINKTFRSICSPDSNHKLNQSIESVFSELLEGFNFEKRYSLQRKRNPILTHLFVFMSDNTGLPECLICGGEVSNNCKKCHIERHFSRKHVVHVLMGMLRRKPLQLHCSFNKYMKCMKGIDFFVFAALGNNCVSFNLKNVSSSTKGPDPCIRHSCKSTNARKGRQK